MCLSNLLFNVNKYTGSHWSLSHSDITQTRIAEISCVQGFIMGPMVIGLWRPIHVSIRLRCYRQEWDNPLTKHSHHPTSPEADPNIKDNSGQHPQPHLHDKRRWHIILSLPRSPSKLLSSSQKTPLAMLDFEGQVEISDKPKKTCKCPQRFGIWKFIYRHYFCYICCKSRPAIVEEETGEPKENHRRHWKLYHIPKQWWETSSSVWKCFRPLSYQGRPLCC